MKTVTITEQTKIDEVIRSCQFCFVAVADVDATPYVFPMNFGYRDGILYLHSGPQGRKTDILEKNPCFFEAYYNLGLLYYNKNEFNESLIYFRKALDLNPASTETKNYIKTLRNNSIILIKSFQKINRKEKYQDTRNKNIPG
ncbi:MAG TPA: pyridoxamine 5'-phosphate oxidase family protein [Candidatus Eremiobacteraeota bacterium]|nr:pyridoxamine 5'-phosphate oxidase family protein [Candidatus Eremiobacteraeota bacterium]